MTKKKSPVISFEDFSYNILPVDASINIALFAFGVISSALTLTINKESKIIKLINIFLILSPLIKFMNKKIFMLN